MRSRTGRCALAREGPCPGAFVLAPERPVRCDIWARAVQASRPEALGAPGFSGLRARFVLGDEAGHHRCSLAPNGPGRSVPEHDPGPGGPPAWPPPPTILH